MLSYGSTLVTLTETYAQTFHEVGTYYFTAEFDPGVSQPIQLIIQAPADEYDGAGGGAGSNAHTGDDRNLALWFVLDLAHLHADNCTVSLFPMSLAAKR
jgi:hypothetical protein